MEASRDVAFHTLTESYVPLARYTEAVERIVELEGEIARLRAVLQEIANEDFRGNRPWSATKAYVALQHSPPLRAV